MIRVRSTRTISSDKKLVCLSWRKFLRITECETLGSGMRIYFSKGEFLDTFTGVFFSENGILRMPERAYCKNIDTVSPSFGKFVNTFTGNATSAPITEVFIRYMDLWTFIRKRFGKIGWTKKNLSDLEVWKNSFRCVAAHNLGLYQFWIWQHQNCIRLFTFQRHQDSLDVSNTVMPASSKVPIKYLRTNTSKQRRKLELLCLKL